MPSFTLPRFLSSSLLVASSALVLGGCGAAADATRPEDPTAAGARGSQSVVVIEAPGTPLVVDWQPEQRGDLEVAMREGVAVVGFGKDGLRLLPDCKIDGTYGFIGVNTKEQVVRLVSGEEVRANLASDALGIIAKLGAELGTSQALDIAIVMVGKRKTTWSRASRSDVVGACEGATHFVRGATIGAFAMRSGAKGTARTVAEIFGSGVTAAAASEKNVQNADGLLEACRKASPESDRPPPQCGALIRLELVALDEPAAAAAKTAPDAGAGPAVKDDSGEVCPTGLVFADGKCTKADSAPHHACTSGDAGDCVAQCEKGNGESCNTLGAMVWNGEGVAKDPPQSARMFARSCELGWGEGCANLATTLYMGVGVEKNPAKAVEIATAACREGVARACTMAGISTLQGEGVRADTARAVELVRAGCRGGDENGCSTLGVMVLGKMGGLAYDERLAAGLFKQACDGGVVMGCTNLGYMIEFGKGVPKDLKLAAAIYGRACSAAPAECVWTGILAQGAIDRTYDPQKARAAFHASCSASPDNPSGAAEAVACVVMNQVFNERVRVNQDALKAGLVAWKETCGTGTERDCTLLGVSAWGLGDVTTAKKFVAEGCRLGDPWACSLRGHAQLK